ncbi:MAG: hypothetical protein IKM36_02575 [Oscillospiraceae bacterium]|nr:hypothetical protein [Oscillospiraceae bacterium]
MKKLLLLLLAVSLCTGAIRALDADRPEEEKLRRALPAQARDLLSTDRPDDSVFSRSGALLRGGIREAEKALPTALRSSVRILLITAICCAVRSLGLRHSASALSLAGTAAITACFAGDLGVMLDLGQRTIAELSDFSKLLIPTMASASALAGAVSSSAAIGSLTTVLMQLFVQLLETVVIPLSGVYVALCTAASGLAQENLHGLASAAGGVMKHSVRTILFLFTAYLSLTGILSESTDAVAMRTAKFTVSAAVPVAGNVLSEASSSILSGAKILQNSIGIFGMLGVLAILIVPFARLGLQYLLLQFTGFCCAAIGGSEEGKLVQKLSFAMGCLAAATAGCAVMVLISCVCFLRLRVL